MFDFRRTGSISTASAPSNSGWSSPDGEWLAGGAGLNLIFGRGGADQLLGGRDNDDLRGGRGADFLLGGSGN